ncbi:MAG: ABC transporter ATP-binding protein [candidate division KSB1 bacterium]
MIRIERLSKTYGAGPFATHALHQVDLTIARSELIALYGASGSGKSTLLNLISGIDRPTAGKIFFEEEEITAMNETRLTLLRRDKIGFVFQFFNLLPTLSILENVLLPAQLQNDASSNLKTRGTALLERLGIRDRFEAFPDQLSGGQQQRVAIARALINNPPLILADEPTGNLDSENGLKILALLKQLSVEEGRTVLLATHSLEAARFANRLYQVRDGKITALAITQ